MQAAMKMKVDLKGEVQRLEGKVKRLLGKINEYQGEVAIHFLECFNRAIAQAELLCLRADLFKDEALVKEVLDEEDALAKDTAAAKENTQLLHFCFILSRLVGISSPFLFSCTLLNWRPV